MEAFIALVMTGIALEALIQLLKNVWDADELATWNYTKFSVYLIPVVVAIIVKPDVSFAGLDFDIDLLRYLISGLIVARIAQWVHAIYKKTT